MTEELADTASNWRGIPSDRVVAVLADLQSGLTQVGSGYLVTGRRVLTAYHCIMDEKTGQPALSLRVVRRSDGLTVQVELVAATLDVAVLEVGDDTAWPPMLLEPVQFGRVDRTHAMELHDCQAVGFPARQVDPQDQGRDAAELHGTIRATEGMESGYLVMRDPNLADVAVPASASDGSGQGSPWGGLSGGLVFYQGLALGVIIEHHPRQGRSALQILPVDRLSGMATKAEGALSENDRLDGASSNGESAVLAVAAALALPPANELPLAEDPHAPIGVTQSQTVYPRVHQNLLRAASQ